MGAQIIAAQLNGIPRDHVREPEAKAQPGLAPRSVMIQRCGYCQRKNKAERDSCKGCGAPL